MLWECSVYTGIYIAVLELYSFMKNLQELLEDDYEDFESLENVEKSFYVIGSELWESKFDGLLALHDSDSGSGLQLHFQSSTGMVYLVRKVKCI